MAKILINQKSRKSGERKLRTKQLIIKALLILSLAGNTYQYIKGNNVYLKQVQNAATELQRVIQQADEAKKK